MSGIFKYTPNRTAANTPNRRSAFGSTGFGGSPGRQQDASSLDNSYAMGFRSPSMNTLPGQGSPAQGRSLREFEEQMSSLRKENFNLKLRIYFLEENAGIGVPARANSSGSGIGHGSPDGATSESLFKQNIDLKVEVESLRKDVQEKQDLLCQAAKAMELMEDSQRKAEEHHREVVGDMEQRLEMLQHELKQMEAVDRHQQQQQQNATRTRLNETGLLDFLDKMEHRDMSVQEKLQSMEMENMLRQYNEQNEELCRRIENLQRRVEEKDHMIAMMEADVNELRFECAEMKDKLEENEKSTSDAEVARLKKDLFEAKSELADKLCELDETETKLKEKSAELVKSVKVVEKLLKTITDQEKESAKLKRNSNPESTTTTPKDPVKKIVTDNGGNASHHPLSAAAQQQIIVDQNKQAVTQEEYDGLCLRLKAALKKNDSLIQKLTGNSTERNENVLIRQLNEELIQAREETDKANRWRKECADLCAISTARLEELAGFLDTLLRSKEFCGSLSMDRRKAIRKAVDRSLDLSRSLNMSISVTGFSLPDNSLANLSSLSGFLNAGAEDSFLVETRTRANKENSYLIPREQSVAKVIECLKAENRELRGQLEGRGGTRKGDSRKKLIPVLADPHSDSEAWSEPDRDVSLARIGLEERSSLINSGVKCEDILQELSSTSENETNVSYMKKQGQKLKELHDTIRTLSAVITAKDTQILDVQGRLVEVDNKLQEERMKASRTQSELENTRHVNQRLEKESNELQDRINVCEKLLEDLSKDIQQKDECIEKLKKDREQAFVDLRVAVMKLDSLRTEHQEVQQKHKSQIDSLLEQENQRLEDVRKDLTLSFNDQLKARQAAFDASLAESYISKNIYTEKMNELEELHFRLEDAHLNLMSLSESESKYKIQLAESEKSVQSMRKALDESTLQVSKVALERTKALNEKRILEDELKQIRCDLETTKAEKNELNAKLVDISAQLRNGNSIKRSPTQRLNSSSGAEGSAASGYTSEELIPGAQKIRGEVKTRLENSSPDLGIESDAGRLSNAESNQCGTTARESMGSPSRPLLKTLELTKSMSNLLMDPKEEADTELNSSALDASDTKPAIHDCAKIEADYAELKRRYKQTRRHLELAYDSIKTSNKRKEQLERDIKQQIQKTNVVLKTVRTNMTNELEKVSPGSTNSQTQGRRS
ncbi:centrosomin isoform X2 [Toxorhynchites rutilus septentrionalis]|uniref:centrosomin isoform X2 n=1 Tax=Toxorhynchites rutilus septentrionalis TaxID=329112 RepID=UPI0024790988|nr:centrosomin isoform X2 [Toxorhynchites rutilus septentrionalis]XP_055637294.1 centrosomin isoform X2 [Toxorhynchites rutilus septentrionalis]XP_055637295.1 centrosomin isoform X2 [Toxorhynchites rutilus septentrionalis]XP_055637296.1 centrosomin isoform X2 [Toxorhynchites rutilus septentrionalis]